MCANRAPKSKLISKWVIILFLPIILMLMSSTLPSGGDKKNTDKLPRYLSTDKSSGSITSPENKSREVLVVIDAGHGGEEWGTYYGDMYEKNVNLDIALKLGPILKEQGIEIAYTREKDVYVGLRERAEMANNLNATLFISIHNNRMPGSDEYRGTETLYAAAENHKFDKMTDKRLAQLVQDELVKSLKTINNGIIYRPELAVLHRTNMPAVIAEIAYISNSSDRERLSDDGFRQKTAQALSNATLAALTEMGARKDKDGKWNVEEK